MAKRTIDQMEEVHEFITKDSGTRQDYASGMVRDIQEGKPRYDLIWRPGLKRLAQLMARGADKYGESNWMLADSDEELARFRASANRHFEQWMQGETDEDHMAATVFNLFAAEMVMEKLDRMVIARAGVDNIVGQYMPEKIYTNMAPDMTPDMAPDAIIADLVDDADILAKPLTRTLTSPGETFDGPLYYEQLKESELEGEL